MLTGLKHRKLTFKNRLLAKCLVAGSVFLCSTGSAIAVANLTTSSAAFNSADPARSNSYMDAGGVWNGATEVTAVGDTFTLTINNTAAGAPAIDTAFDLQDVIVTVAAGFQLAANTLNINNVVGLPTCPNISVGTAQQSGGVGTPITLNIDANEDVLPGCRYELSFGLTTATSVAAGSHPLSYSINYDDNLGNPVVVPVPQSVDVNTGGLSITKTTLATSAASGAGITYNVAVTSTGSGGLFDVRLNDVLSSDLNGLTFTVPNPPPGATGPGPDDYTFEYLAAGEVVNLTVDATVTPTLACPILNNSANLSERRAVATDSAGPVNVQFDFQFTSGAFSNVITHAASSYCEFCGDGVVSITVQNPSSASLTNITLVEDLLASGLVYVPGTTTINAVAAADPAVAGTQLTWNLADLAGLSNHVISFGVRSIVAENLITAIRDFRATVDFDVSCLVARQSVNTGEFEVPIRQPLPTIIKDGRNFDAGQSDYSDPIFGNENDDVIWRVNVQNTGLANMEALRMNDAIGGNFNIGSICPTEASAVATATAGGGVIAPCIAMTSPFNVADPFGNIANPDDIAASSNDFVYYVGRILAAHTNETNTNDVSWGCAVDSPTGGSITVPASTGGGTPGVTITDTGDLSTTVIPANLQITQSVTGSNPGQPLGTKGLVTVTINNQTGGSIKNIRLRDTIPIGYVVDDTFGSDAAPADCDCTVSYTPAYGTSYDGFIDTVLRDDPQRATPDPLDDISPEFTFTSSTIGADANQQHLLRHGDIVTLTFGIIMVDQARYDRVADLDIATENTADGTDPDNALAYSNVANVDFDAADAAGPQTETESNTFNATANPEDLDVDISDALFILTNDPGTPLDLHVDLTNSGGHDADDYTLYVTLGQAMTVTGTGIPTGCAVTTNPPPHPLWNQPSFMPVSAAVFACDRGTHAAGASVRYTFTVLKAASPAVDDDLTFRADVVGEIHQFASTPGTPLPLTFPAPASLPNTTPNLQLANNYSLDAYRSRVLGFNLTKSAWYCTESGLGELPPSNPPPATPAELNTQIGEDCNYFIESGGWFGFVTPGFTLIAVENVAVTDDLPDGQGFIHFGGSPFDYTGRTPGITMTGGPDGGAGTTPLDETDITWNFNASGAGISVKDEFFRVNFKTRLLNDPVDLAYPVPGGYAPNLHGNTSTNIARTSFDAIFNSPTGNITISVDDAAGIPGYPVPAVRTVDLTEVEPNLIVTKQVCNETLNGFGTGCSGFADAINNGDTDDSYIYRITLTNETSAPIRSPAYNVIATDTLDASGLMLVVDFATDGLDNDGDGAIDGADANGEGSIAGNTIGVPAVITIDESHSTALLQIDSGATITFYYRVDPHITIAPLQLLTNSVSLSFDSLQGDFGNQNPPQLNNAATAPNDVGRARIYTSITQIADVRMIPLAVNPKIVLGLSNTTFVPLADPHDVTIGEEIRYELFANLPVANLRQLRVRDELPPGLRCVEGQTVNLDAPPYAVAMFVPGGTFSAVCGNTGTHDFVEWNFGDQAVTNATPGFLFNFRIEFIARVENSALTNEGTVLTNGGVSITDAATCTSAGGGGVGICYQDGAIPPNNIALNFGAVAVTVREPVIVLTKSFAPVTNSDAADELLVTVTAENTGTAAAYNLQILDDLLTADMTYINDSMAGAHAPDDDAVAADSKQPIFSWDRVSNTHYEILPAETKTFTFRVRVDISAQPLEILDNTLQAKWDSLPGQDVALPHAVVAPGIGADGTLRGLRNGAVPNAANAINDYEATITAQTTVLPLTMTKTDLDVGVVVPTIGAHRNFEVVIDLPEGTTENLIIEDVLATAGVSYVLRRDGGAFDITYTFQDIVSIEGSAPSEGVFRGATLGVPTIPLDGDAGTIRWDIGQVITVEEDDQTINLLNPRIIINYFARPNNDVATNDGVTLQNSATTTYDNGETALIETLNDTTAIQTVVEPLLLIAKAVSNVTNPGVGPVAGDVLEYQITVTHDAASNATAFDSNIVDTLDDNLLLDASFTPTALLDGVAVGGFAAVPTITAPPASTFTWGRDNADNNLDIPNGSTLILTYRTVVQNTIEANFIVSNSVLIDWTSLNDSDPSSAFERTGAGCPATVGSNDYCSAPAVANITADDSNSIIKTIIFDTYDEAPLSTALDSTVRVGDIATYQLDINIQQGTTVNASILDTIAAGLELVDIISINGVAAVGGFYAPPAAGVGSNFSYPPIPIASVPVAGARLSLNWSLGIITNDFTGDGSTDTLVIIYRARVFENDVATIAQSPSTLLTNTANFTYIDGIGNPSPADPRLNDTAVLTVLQPVMDALTKTDRSGRVSGDPVDVTADTMNFRLHSCNTTGLARAYGLLLTDNLPTQLNESTIAGPTNGALAPDVFIDGVLATPVTDYIYTPPAVRGGNMEFRFNTPIDPNVCIDIDFDVTFYTDFGFGSFSNLLDINEYFSLPPANAQLYGPIIPTAEFIMNNPATAIPPPAKVKLSADEATIGDEVVYRITVPSVATGAILFDVTVTDILHDSLLYVSAIDTGASGFTITDTVLAGNTVNLVIAQIPAGQQAIIELRARVANNVAANAGVNFNNTASYSYADASGGLVNNAGSDITVNSLNIVEPVVTVTKDVANITKPGLAPDAGDVLRYTITLTASGGAAAPADFNSDAFDLSLEDSLSLGLLYNGNETVNGGNTISTPVIVGDGVVTPQSLSWNLAAGNADIDVTEGAVVTVAYDVLVLDSVLADQNLSNSVDIQWSSRDGPDTPGGLGEGERNGSAVPPLNDYFNLVSAVTLQTTPDNNVISKTRLTDTFNPLDNIVRIGDIVDYELRITLQEGTSANFVIQDTLAEGLIFEQTVSINGQTVAPYPAVSPFTHAAISAAVVAGDPATGPTTVTWNAGNVINAGDNNITNDDFVIVYRARVLNLALPQVNNTPLANSVNVDYAMASGAAPTKTANQLLDLQQPNLSVVKTSLPVAGSVIGATDVVTYTIDIINGGASIAYDVELTDTIPAGLRSPAITMVSMTLLSGSALPGILPPVYNPVTGATNWNFDTGIADQYNIPAGDTLRLVYSVQADAGLGTGLTLTNAAQVQFYYSFDNDAVPTALPVTGVREIYGPSNLAQVSLTSTPANPLLKANPVDLNASIGEAVIYRLTIPEVAQTTALYDVRILDNLNASAANLMFSSVTRISGSQPWIPANIGTVSDDLIIADLTNGIDIPANEQVVIDIAVVLRDAAPNTAALPTFNNTASYTFNRVNDDNATVSNGSGNTTPLMTIVEPDLTLLKTGPAGTVNFTAAIAFSLEIENIGNGPAFDTTVIDRLPALPDNPPLTGGTCDTTPINIVANVFANDGATLNRALLLGTDYTAVHSAAPTCELVITTLSDTARIEATEKLIVTYETTLNVATQSGALLTNIAGVTQWFSLDTAGAGATDEIRTYTRTISDGTPGILDFQDAFTVTVEAPILEVEKTVVNVTTGQNPGNDATPSDVLRYTIVINNSGLIDANAVTVSDAIPLNATYVANSTTLNTIAVPDAGAGISPLMAGFDISSSDLTPPLPGVGGGVITVGESATITFDVLLDPVITSGTIIENQAIADSPSTGPLPSDDPNLAGLADLTQTLITSAPEFVVQKVSQDISGDPAILLAGDTLRYTLTVKNIGQENAVSSLLADSIPANTTYIANSTRLNTVLVADPVAGISPLNAGMLINAPENTTAGFLRADTNLAANNVASITFDVMINLSTVNGTIISNQGFFSGSGAGSGVFPLQPSDDPATALVDDPTIDVVGNVPVVDVIKIVAILIDVSGNAQLDPGDTLRYTIISNNIGALAATDVVLTDAVPANTTYVANSTTLNTLPVADAGVGISPLIAGIAMSSSDLTPPLPAPGGGVLSAAGSATVTFDVVVNGATPAGTIISNQGFVANNELPTEPSDADGNDANGNQPTVIVVGNVQQLSITKQVSVVGGGAAEAGKILEYVVRVTNIGSVTAIAPVITDDLDLPTAGQMSYVAGSGLLNGLPAGVAVAGSVITVTIGDMAPAAVAELRFRATLSATLLIGEAVINTADVTWNVPLVTLSATASIDIGGIPGSVVFGGQVWNDIDFSNDIGSEETLLADYRVDVFRNGTLLGSTTTGANGVFGFSGLPPNLPTGDAYVLRYFAPGAVATTATLGNANSAFTDGPQFISDIFAASGSNVLALNLPRQANGVVFDSILRAPVAGVQLSMINQTRSNQPVPGSCFDDPVQANQVTLVDGYYKFDLNFSDAGRCADGDEYEIQVTPPTSGFIGSTSVIIPPRIPVTDAAFDVPNCLGTAADRVPATTQHCEISDGDTPAPATVPPRTPRAARDATGTGYQLKFLFDAALFTDQIFNNHIAVDSRQETAVAISKVAGKLNVTRADLVPYTITFTNTLGVPMFDVSIVDNFPAGFKYVADSARVDGVAVEPTRVGRTLTWPSMSVDISESRIIKLLLIVGSGVGEGEYVNTAQAFNERTGEIISPVATATVRVIPDPTFDCTDVIGKVYEDKNLNSYQDKGERGIPGVQVATARGLRVTTDAHGRFHITCAVVANEVRGSNFIMKLDDRSLPAGYRVTTENPRVQRATRGKMMKFNFGTAIHRVVRLDLADGVFEKGSTELRPQWRTRIDFLITELQKEGSVLRLSYMAENELEDEVDDRLEAIEELISDRWQALDCCYRLTIETEVFWRKGSPEAGREFK